MIDKQNIYNKLYIDDTRALQDLSSKQNKKILLNRIDYLTQILKDKNYNLILLYGTLLGFVRDKNFINNDHDVDIGIILENDDIRELKNLFTYLKKEQCTITKTYSSKGQYHIKIIDRTLDLWIVWIKNDKLFVSDSIYGELNKEDLLPLKQIKINNYYFQIPNNPEKLFNFWYENWRIKSDKTPIMRPNIYLK